MFKLIEFSSFYKDKETSVTVIPVGTSSGELEKLAASEELTNFVKVLEPKPGHTYLHINAMTAGEYHGSNRNGDFFPEENLKQYYKTFETTPARVYRSHINKDPRRSYGKVIFAIYNEDMHRVELIAECPDELVSDINSRISAGDYPATSMAAKTPYDLCSICGNKAHTRDEYCVHLKRELNKMYPDGRKVFAINSGPLTFFDISIVVRPADVNSSILRKVAGDGLEGNECIGSAELAIINGLTETGIGHRKLSELIKEIEDDCSHVVSSGKTPLDLLNTNLVNDLPIEVVDRISHFEMGDILSSLSDMGITPSINFLAELIAKKHLGDGYEGIGELVEQYLHHIPHDTDVPDLRFLAGEGKEELTAILKPYFEKCSLLPSVIEKRASQIGYFGNGPTVEPTSAEREAALAASSVHKLEEPLHFGIGTGKLLLGLGIAALMAKYLITSQIEKKLREHPVNNTKIIIVKKASESTGSSLGLTKLAKSSMYNALPGNSKASSKNLELVVESSEPSVGIHPGAIRRLLVKSNTVLGRKLSGLLKFVSLSTKTVDTVKTQID